jgi:hypothetical protein
MLGAGEQGVTSVSVRYGLPLLLKARSSFLGKAATAASFGALNRKADYSALGAEVTIEKLPHQGVCLWVAEAVSGSFHQTGALGLKYAFAPSKS